MCVRIAIDLEIFTTLTERGCPTRLEELAAVKGADPILTERVLRILTGIGYVAEHDVRVYIPTAMTRQMTDRLTWLAIKPGHLDACNTFMEADRGSRPSWLEWFPVQEPLIEGYQKGDSDVLLVDVAGRRGHDIAAFQTKFPDAPGRLVLEDLSQVLESAVVHPKIDHISFDLFKPQPIQGARTYYLKFILHDWSDEDCRRILRHVGAAMKKGYSKLIIEEFVLADRDCDMLPAMWDWEMLIFCNSMERTADRWRKLIGSAGFRVVKFWPPPGDGQGIIEAQLELN
ncbi:methyltransferase [Aspergillus uvarum CBS 121591]|uniref:Methyltransferase n=1 Tax=Aspergillus uvarum CBS 121591 TaxID=1448315 RepID=A0A319CME0_9EURO|nr:methyltransferase [Aspergillus uvarum CBS 121591]PYH85720.1 methyltransferase [Aspergillus uvarum CBS 121591]